MLFIKCATFTLLTDELCFNGEAVVPQKVFFSSTDSSAPSQAQINLPFYVRGVSFVLALSFFLSLADFEL